MGDLRTAKATLRPTRAMTTCSHCGGSTFRPFGYSPQGVARDRCQFCGRVRNNHGRPCRAAARQQRIARPLICRKCSGNRFAPHGYGRNGLAIDRCLSCGRQVRNYQRERHVGDARIVVSSDATSMDAALILIAAGVFSVGQNDAIWRHARFDKWGRRTTLDPPKRADFLQTNGYRRVHFRAGGRQHEINAARIAWVFRHGAVPSGYRVGGARGNEPHLVTWVDNGRAARRADGESLLVKVNASVPTWLPDEIRSEVCQDIAVAVLSGVATIDQIPGLVRDYKNRVHRKLWPYFERLSLDAPIREGSTTTFGAFT